MEVGRGAAFRALVTRGVKAVATCATVTITPNRGGDGSSAGDGTGKGSGGSSSSGGGGAELRIPTSLKGIGAESLLDYPTPEIRRTATARLEENPKDVRWFQGVEVASAPKQRVANRLWRSAKGRWADSLGGMHSQSEEEGSGQEEEAPTAAAAASAAAAAASNRKRSARKQPPAPEQSPAPAASDPALAAAAQQMAQLQAQLQAAQAQVQQQLAQAQVQQQAAQAQATVSAAASASTHTHAAAPMPAPRQPPDFSSPPGDVRAIQKRLAGLQRAQLVNCTDAREEQIGELEFELDERKRKFRKYGHWGQLG
jgi:hypothetical protein